MRLLKAAVVIMGVLIVVGTATLATLIVQRLSGGVPGAAPASLVLDEPTGTRIVAAAATGERLVLHLQGGGGDRVVVVDLRSGKPILRLGLAR